jgi:multidrug transporter EmrE-like cation transporter
MRTNLAFYLIGAVLLSATAQVLLKAGVSTESVQSALLAGSRSLKVLAVATSPLVIAGLAVYAVSAVLWLVTLSRVDLSYAYPFVGLGFLVTMGFGVWSLGEPLTPMRLIGTGLVALGVSLVALTA